MAKKHYKARVQFVFECEVELFADSPEKAMSLLEGVECSSVAFFEFNEDNDAILSIDGCENYEKKTIFGLKPFMAKTKIRKKD